ncbi:MAG: hypothetical protein GY795_11940 [Desulfobacterales bacterium]|nr:hypothetical protein [Desulfobacterales bacterium]
MKKNSLVILAITFFTIIGYVQTSLASGNSNNLISQEIDKIVFIKRPTYHASHFYTFFIDGLDKCFNSKNGIYIFDLKTGQEKPLITCDQIPGSQNGIFGRLDVSFDAKRVVFDFKPNIASGFRIWEVNIDGTGLRQITFDPPDEQERITRYDKTRFEVESPTYNNHTDDMHPCYLPDGGFAFVSTRVEHEVLCNPSGQLSACVLYRIDADGSNMEKLSNGPVSEFNPSVTESGQILYSRWEYVDKSSVSIKALWLMNPDGSKSSEIFGNNHNLPPSMWQPRQIPGQAHLFVFTGVPHCCEQAGYGTVMLADTSKDIRTWEPVEYITPDTILTNPEYEGGWSFRNGTEWIEGPDGVGGKLYADPYPISKDRYFVSCKYNINDEWNDPDAYGIYLIDKNGSHEIIKAPENGSGVSYWNPVPLRERTMPPVISRVQIPSLKEKNLAACIVTDVYQGLDNVPRGTVKWLRINEQIPRPWGSNRLIPGFVNEDGTSSNNRAHFWIRLQYGIVPVESDGSAYFTVPADRNIFFEALDENYMEVQRERTFVNYRPGETRSCIGCHERTGEAPKANTPGTPIAMTRTASSPGPQPGEISGTRILDYRKDIQPIWNKHCIGCHSSTNPSKDLDLSETEVESYTVSYESLIAKHFEGFEEPEEAEEPEEPEDPEDPEESEEPKKTKRSENTTEKRLLGIMVDEDSPNFQLDGIYLPPYSLGAHTSRLADMLKSSHQKVVLTQPEMIRITTWIDNNCQFYGTYYGRRDASSKDHPNYRPDYTVEQALSKFPFWIDWDDR